MAVIKLMVYITCFCLYQDLVFCDDYGENGNNVTLTPSIRGKPEEILWTHNGNKVLEYDGSEVEKYGSFQGRVEVDFQTGQLTIRKLNSQDNGKYQYEILINGKLQISSHTLTVLDALPEPRVTCELDEASNLKKLSCSVESQTQPSYEWSGPDVKQPGPTLLVDEQEEKRDSVYTCTVKNKAVSRTTDFTLQDCHTGLLAGGASPSVLVPVLIVSMLLIILLAVLVLYLYRRKKQKSRESEQKKMDTENGECDNLLRNFPVETMPGSSNATLPCCIRLTAPKESIADKKWDHDSKSENSGETHEGQKLLKTMQSEDPGNTNERQLEKNYENADEAEENINSKQDKTDREIKSQNSSQTQEEMEKEESQIMKNESENEEKSPEEQTETLGKQETEDTDKNEDDQTPGDKMEEDEENEETNSSNTGSSDATLTAPKESSADKKCDQDSGSENATHEEEKEEEKENKGTDSPNTGELDENEKSGKIADEAEENSNAKTDETQSQKTEDADKHENHQTPKEKKEKEGEKKETDSPNKETVSPQPAVTERSTMDTGNIEDSPNKGSSDATLTAPKESSADKKCDQDSGSENATHEEKKEEEKENKGTDSPNTGELDENEKSGKIADEAEENSNGKTDETQSQKTEDADKNENDQTPKEKKEKEEEKKETDSPNKETVSPQPAVTERSTMDTGNVEDSPNKGSSDATLTAPKESIADKKYDQDSGSENATHEEKKEEEKENKGTESLNTGELDENEKSGKIANEAEENFNGKTDETQSQKTEDADKNENHQTPKEKKEKEEEKTARTKRL
ncbi:hypothetical protein QQF64_034144 [Cirrhinus molitorella]|uniref:Ig-like domain-containing protein n=1 Tax=Cirrhinus molitorella TaxID=172907 RepID=A0ABR3MVU6_9TELE